MALWNQRPFGNAKIVGPMTIRTNDPSNQWLRTTGPIFGLMNLRTINFSDQWPFKLLTIRTYGTIFGPMTLQTTDHADQCTIFGAMNLRTNDHSEYRAVPNTNNIDRGRGHLKAELKTCEEWFPRRSRNIWRSSCFGECLEKRICSPNS